MNAQELSWLALWGAVALYAIAMVASSIHLARVADAKVAAKTRAKAAVAAGGVPDERPAPASALRGAAGPEGPRTGTSTSRVCAVISGSCPDSAGRMTSSSRSR